MSVRFCEFCSTVHPDEMTHCPGCGTPLRQSAAKDYFYDGSNPWPFLPVKEFCLRIQGQPRKILFNGTTSVYHFWTALHHAYENMQLYYRIKQDEMELIGFPADPRAEGLTLLDPAVLLGCKYRNFTFHTHVELHPDIASEPGERQKMFQGNFSIEECPAGQWGLVLGWLAATAPRQAADVQWTYDI